MLELILGGARSGKSTLAEQRAIATNFPVTYIATAQALDAEMTSRIAHHRQQRPAHWQLIEESIAIAKIIEENSSAEKCLLIDCLTLWLSNIIESQNLTKEIAALVLALKNASGHIILVSNEVGMGIVPLGAINRLFVDEQGRLNQKIAQIADSVTFVAAGLPLQLK